MEHFDGLRLDGLRVMWVCTDCYFEYHLPGEGELPDNVSREDLWSRENRNEWGPGYPFGMRECPHDFERDWNTPAGEKHEDECCNRDFSWSPCDACGSHLGGSRHAFQQEVTA